MFVGLWEVFFFSLCVCVCGLYQKSVLKKKLPFFFYTPSWLENPVFRIISRAGRRKGAGPGGDAGEAGVSPSEHFESLARKGSGGGGWLGCVGD